MSSGPRRITVGVTSPIAISDLLSAPVATAEFLVVDTETNGLAGDACEMTEVGAVLVGGGELHDRWSSLCRTSAPLQRGIQRFTGITQAMVDSAPSLEDVLPPLAQLLAGRILVAHNAPFDRRVLRQAFDRIGLEWPNPPVICTAAVARRLLPLQRKRGLGALADALGIEVELAHRALADAETCARVLCALFPRLCANAVTVADALALLAPARRRRTRGSAEVGPLGRLGSGGGRGAAQRRPRGVDDAVGPAPEFGELPSDPGVYLFRDAAGKILYVGKSVSIRSRARAHFAPSSPPAAWTGRAQVVDYRTTGSELGALILESRLIAELKPPGNKRLTRRDDRLVYIRCRLDIEYPILDVAPDPAAGHAVSIGPVARPAAGAGAGRAAGLAVRPAPLRPAAAAPRVSVRLRADGALPVTVSGRPGSEPVPAAVGPGAAAVRRRSSASLGRDRARRCWTTSTTSCDARRPSAATSGRRRCTVERDGCGRSWAGSTACSSPRTRGRCWCWRAIRRSPRSRDSGWPGGRLVDSGVIADGEDLAARCEAAARRGGRAGELGAHVPPGRDRAGQDPADVAGVASGHGDAGA